MRLKYCLLAILCPLLSIAQDTSLNEIVPLSIGDKVPDITFNRIINYRWGSAKLSDFKGKLVILDFWSTSCSTCIQLFPHMDSLQKQFGDRLQIILVNAKSRLFHDDEIKIRKVLDRLKSTVRESFNLPVVYGIDTIDAYFPCQYVPHEVWINGQEEVAAITPYTEVTDKNIEKMLGGGIVNMHTKKDLLNIDLTRPVLSIIGDSMLQYRSTITGYVEGIGSFTGVRRNKDGQINGYFSYNKPVLALYRDAFREVMKYPSNRTFIETKHLGISNLGQVNLNPYTNSYCYELVSGGVTQRKALKYMQQDLNRVFGITVHNEVRKIPCLLLRATKTARLSFTKGGTQQIKMQPGNAGNGIRNYAVSDIVQNLNELLPLPLIDATGIKTHIDLKLPANLSDEKAIFKSLVQAGYIIKQEDRNVEVTVISDKEK